MKRSSLAALLAFATAASGIASAQPSAGVQSDTERVTAEKLRKVHSVVHQTEAGFGLLSKGVWTASVLMNRPELTEASGALRSVLGPIKELDGALDQLNRLVNQQQAKQESRGFIGKLKLVKLGGQLEELERCSQKIRDIPIGLVSDGLDDRFKVSPDLLTRKPKEAERRFAELLAAMRTNVAYLQTQQARLEEIQRYGKAASKGLDHFNNGIEIAVRAGFFTEALVAKYLDVGRLSKACSEIAADAGRKAREARDAAAVQEQRHDNLRETVRTLFGFHV